MKRTIIFIHGSYGHPNENWFPWLKAELGKLGCNVIIPKFPTPKDQTLENWMKILNEYDDYFNTDTIMVGHSIGPALILRKLETLKKPIKAVFLVSGWIGNLGINEIDKLIKSFYEKPFEWNKIKKNSKHFFIYHSDNDPYVPLKMSIKLANKLGTDVNLVKGAGHFNEKAGYTKFPLILKDIKKLIK